MNYILKFSAKFSIACEMKNKVRYYVLVGDFLHAVKFNSFASVEHESFLYSVVTGYVMYDNYPRWIEQSVVRVHVVHCLFNNETVLYCSWLNPK